MNRGGAPCLHLRAAAGQNSPVAQGAVVPVTAPLQVLYKPQSSTHRAVLRVPASGHPTQEGNVARGPNVFPGLRGSGGARPAASIHQTCPPRVRSPAPPRPAPAVPAPAARCGAGRRAGAARPRCWVMAVARGSSVIEHSLPGWCPRCGCNQGRGTEGSPRAGHRAARSGPAHGAAPARGVLDGTGLAVHSVVLGCRCPPRPRASLLLGPPSRTPSLDPAAQRARAALQPGARLPEAGGGAGVPRGGGPGAGRGGRNGRRLEFRSDARRPAT